MDNLYCINFPIYNMNFEKVMFMKKIFKNNIYIIISVLILVCWYSVSLKSFLNNLETNKSLGNKFYEECLNSKSDEECDIYKPIDEEYEVPPAPLLYTYIISNGDYNIRSLSIVLVLFVAIPSIVYFYRNTKSGMFKNELTRDKYCNYFMKNYKKSLKCLLILPLFLIISFFITCIVSNFRFQYLPGAIETEGSFWTNQSYARSEWIKYFFTMFWVIIFHSYFYINLAYITFYKCKSFVINVLITYISYIFSQVVIVYAIQFFLSNILMIHNSDLIISLEDPLIMTFGGEVKNYAYILLSSAIYMAISATIVYFLYRKKERFVIANE